MDRNSAVKGRWPLIVGGAAMLLFLFALVGCVVSWEKVERESEDRIERQKAVWSGDVEGAAGAIPANSTAKVVPFGK